MANSIESRLPFLDFRLVNNVLNAQNSLKIKDGKTKVLIREGLTHILPTEICNRHDKKGFVTPDEEWLRGSLKGLISNWIESRSKFSEKYISEDLLAYTKKVISGELRYDLIAWRVIIFLFWAEVFNVEVNQNG